MDVKVSRLSLENLLGKLGDTEVLVRLLRDLATKKEKPPEVTQEELAGFKTKLDAYSDEMLIMRRRIANGMDQTKDVFMTGIYGQAHAFISTAGTALVSVIELLECAEKMMEHAKTCPCVTKEEAKSEAPTESPAAEASAAEAS